MILKSINKKRYFNDFFFRENMLENKKRLKLITKKMKLPKKNNFY